MMPSKEYLDMISQRLEKLNPDISQSKIEKSDYTAYCPSMIDQIGMTAMHYLKNKDLNKEIILPDPNFPDRNTY